MRTPIRLLGAVILLACAIAADVQAQPAAGAAPAGHWVGSLDVGGGLAIEIDLGRQGAGWRGTMSVPAQGSKGVPLADVTVKNTTVEFAIKGGCWRSTFQRCALRRWQDHHRNLHAEWRVDAARARVKGEPQFAPAVKNKPIPAALIGSWEARWTSRAPC